MSANSAVEKAPPVRDHSIDFAKGIGIICVILGHTSRTPALLHYAFYTFHVPLFFVIAGYLFSQRTVEMPFKSFLTRKCNALLKPYLILALGIWGKTALLHLLRRNPKELLDWFVKLVLQQRFTTLWFLAALFFANFIFYFVCLLARKLGKNQKQINLYIFVISFVLSALFIAYGIFIGWIPFWNIDIAFVAQIFMAIGYFSKNKIVQLRESKKKQLGFGLFGLLLCAGIAFLNHLCGASNLEMFTMEYGIPPFTVSAAIFGSFGVILLSGIVRCRPIEYLGKNSLIYFGWHQVIALPFAREIVEKMTTVINCPFLNLAAVFTIVIAICFVLDKLLELTKIKQWMMKK